MTTVYFKIPVQQKLISAAEEENVDEFTDHVSTFYMNLVNVVYGLYLLLAMSNIIEFM